MMLFVQLAETSETVGEREKDFPLPQDLFVKTFQKTQVMSQNVTSLPKEGQS